MWRAAVPLCSCTVCVVCPVCVPQFVLFLSAHLASVCSLLFPPQASCTVRACHSVPVSRSAPPPPHRLPVRAVGKPLDSAFLFCFALFFPISLSAINPLTHIRPHGHIQVGVKCLECCLSVVFLFLMFN